MTDQYTLGFLDGMQVATRIVRNHIGGIRPEAPAAEAVAGVERLGGVETGESPSEGGGEGLANAFPSDIPQPMTIWAPPTIGFYRMPEETDVLRDVRGRA